MPTRKPKTKKHDGRGQYDRSVDAKTRDARQMATLVDAATHVFGTVGAREATVEMIVTRAGMSRRTFYEHFSDLRECLMHVHTALAEEAYAMVHGLISNIEDPLDRVRAGISAYFAAIITHPVSARVLFREIRNAGPEFEARWEIESGRFAGMLFDALNAAHENGHLSIKPDEMSVLALTTGIEAVGIRHLSKGTEAALFNEAPKMAELVIRAFR